MFSKNHLIKHFTQRSYLSPALRLFSVPSFLNPAEKLRDPWRPASGPWLPQQGRALEVLGRASWAQEGQLFQVGEGKCR